MRRIKPTLTNTTPARTPRVIRTAPPVSLALPQTLRRTAARRRTPNNTKVPLPVHRVQHAEAARRAAKRARVHLVRRAGTVGVVGAVKRVARTDWKYILFMCGGFVGFGWRVVEIELRCVAGRSDERRDGMAGSGDRHDQTIRPGFMHMPLTHRAGRSELFKVGSQIPKRGLS